MNKLIALGAAAFLLAPSMTFAFSLQSYEAETKVAARMVSGALDQRLIDLGSNLQTKEFFPIWGRTLKDGVAAYCRFYMKSVAKDTSKCTRTIKVTAPNGNYSF